MRRYLAIALLLALSWPAQAPAARPVCGPKAAKTIVENERLRIYKRNGSEVVCSRYSSRRWSLWWKLDEDEVCGSQGCGPGRTKLMVAGRWVLQVIYSDGGQGRPYRDVIVRAAGARHEAVHVRVDGLYDVLLRRSGETAFIARTFDSFLDPVGRLTVERRGCEPTTLDEGPEIDPRSLRYVDGRLSWLNAGAERTAPACPAR